MFWILECPDQKTAMAITGLPEEKVRVHTTFLGGGFGRRHFNDFDFDPNEIDSIQTLLKSLGYHIYSIFDAKLLLPMRAS